MWHTNFEPFLRWDPHVFFNGSKVLCVLLHDKIKNKHLFVQIHESLNEIMASKVGTMSMDIGFKLKVCPTLIFYEKSDGYIKPKFG